MSYKVLVAEDNFINQKLMEKIFQSLDWECIIVADGCEVVNEAKKGIYDIILMDISMPDMDGHEASQLIREFNTDIPIIAITANAIQGFRERCIASGMNDYIAKPFKKAELCAMMDRYLPPQ